MCLVGWIVLFSVMLFVLILVGFMVCFLDSEWFVVFFFVWC